MVNRIADSIPLVPSTNSLVSSTIDVPEIQMKQDKTVNSSSLNQGQENQSLLSAEKAKMMTQSINRFMETTNTNLRFQYHEELREYYVTIVDSKTNELVKEIPSKKLMDIYAAMRDFLGLMVDHKI